MSAIDVGFILAVMAFGWGLSLASYRAVAGRLGWPMGVWQVEWPALTVTLGTMCILLAILFSLARGYGGYVISAWAIPVFGVAWAIFWTGFLRVGAQSALLLAPPAAALLMVRWLG
jgi:hypothetical protein